MTVGLLVSQICANTVTGSCKDSSAWLHTRPENGSPTSAIAASATAKQATTPTELWRSRMS